MIFTDIRERNPSGEGNSQLSHVLFVGEDANKLGAEHDVRRGGEQAARGVNDDREPIHHLCHVFRALTHILRDSRRAR